MVPTTEPTEPRHAFWRIPYVQVLIGVGLGIAVGALWPSTGVALKPLGDGFIKLVKMIIAPVIFCTVVGGIAGMRDLKKVGRVGGKALLYFELVSTLALALGLLIANTLTPGAGFDATITEHDQQAVADYASRAQHQSSLAFFLGIIPETVVGAFAEGNILQVLLVAILSGVALSSLGARGEPLLELVNLGGEAIFGIVKIVMKVAPIGAIGAMAFTIGQHGVASLANLLKLIGTFYLTSGLFVVIVLGTIARVCGFSIFKFIARIKDELLLVLGTSSSESALPSLMQKLEGLGCSRSVVGLVVPTGYSFNLDGTNIYMTLAALFIAQATNTPLTLTQELTILGVAMLTSKGATGVTGSGFVTLAATLSVVPTIPVAGMALILGIDRFMSECRALTNIIGNGVATVVVSRWEGELDAEKLKAIG